METSSVLLVIIFGIGAAQGLINGGILLLSKEGNLLARRLYAFMLLALAYLLLKEILLLFGLGKYDLWYHILVDFNWTYGPLLYLLVRARMYPERKLRKTDWVLVIPLVIELICSNFVRTQNFYWDGTKESLSWAGYWGYMLWMNYPTRYIIGSALLSYFALKSNQLLNSIPEQMVMNQQEANRLKRLIRTTSIYFFVFALILVVDMTIYLLTNDSYFYFYFTRFFYYPFFIGIAGLTYWLGFVAIRQQEEVLLSPAPPSESVEKLAQYEQIIREVSELMTSEKLYLDPELKLAALANRLAVKPYLLSKSLNTIQNVTFTDYINLLRVEDVERSLRSGEKDHLSLLGIALDAGFNSKTSFQRATQKFRGLSPSELKRSILEEKEALE